MHQSFRAKTLSRSAVAFGSLATSALFLAGCSSAINTSGSGSSGPLAMNTGAVSGRVHGGNQPVAGATVSLYFAGTSGFSTTGARRIATTTSAADGFGSFGFTLDPAGTAGGNAGNDAHFHCASGTDTTYVFVVAKGGSTVNGSSSASNPDAEFISPMAPCNSISTGTFVNMSEVSTVATIAAIHQFMNASVATSTPIEQSVSSDSVFASNNALSNAFDLVYNMVDPASGLARTSLTRTGSANGSQGVSVTITPETAKINQLANIISSCINFAPSPSSTRNSNCTSIYNAATPAGSGSSTATDLFTALYYIFTNTNLSSSNIGTLNSFAGTGPYTPTLTTAPTDWSIGINYASSSTCNNGSSTGGSFYSSPATISINQYGNLLVANNNAALGSLSQLSPIGTPLSCTTLTPVTGIVTPTVFSASSTIYVPNNTTVYTYSGAPNSRDLYQYSSATGAVTTLTATEPVLALAAAGTGDLFYSTTGGNLYEIPVGSSTSTRLNSNVGSLGNAYSIAVDDKSRVWASSNASYVTYFVPTFSGITISGYDGGTVIPTSGPSRSLMVTQVTVPNRTTVYTVDPSSSTITAIVATNNSTSATDSTISSVTLNTGFTPSNAGISNPGSAVLDGSGVLWLANTTAASISGVNASGVAVTPSTGLSKAATPVGNNASAIAIDAGGNIWVSSSPTSVTEVVGTATPLFVPYASALSTGRFQTAP